MPITLKDLSIKSGFSVTTVSRALGGYSDVNEKTRAHILKIADELGYHPNTIARQLQGQKTNTIGIIVPHRDHILEDDFFSILLKSITYEAAKNQFDVLVGAVQPKASEIDMYKRFVGGRRVDAMILARTRRNDPRIKYLQSINAPFIVHGRLSPDETSDFSYIDVDSQLGIQLLVEHLIERGHSQIGLILPNKEIAYTAYRLAGYRDALTQRDIVFNQDNYIYSDLTYQGGQDAAKALLQRNSELTAIVGCNDWMALGAMKVVKEQGYQVGKDFAIAGYDNIPAAMQASPPLTTIHQPIYEVGEKITREITRQLTYKPATVTQILIKPTLIIRESSGGS